MDGHGGGQTRRWVVEVGRFLHRLCFGSVCGLSLWFEKVSPRRSLCDVGLMGDGSTRPAVTTREPGAERGLRVPLWPIEGNETTQKGLSRWEEHHHLLRALFWMGGIAQRCSVAPTAVEEAQAVSFR